MAGLANRLKKLQVMTSEPRPDFSHMSIQELEECQIDFGSKHLGDSLPPRMDQRSTLGHVADPTLRQFQEELTSEVPSICRDENRALQNSKGLPFRSRSH